MRGRVGRTAFLEELEKLGVPETFSQSDVNDVTVALPEVGWKGKAVEILEINRPEK